MKREEIMKQLQAYARGYRVLYLQSQEDFFPL